MVLLYIIIAITAGMIVGSFLAWLILLIFFQKKKKIEEEEYEEELTIKEWYKIEQKKIEELNKKEKNPMIYVEETLEQLKKEPNENREIAILKIKEELILIQKEDEEDARIEAEEKEEITEEAEMANSTEENKEIEAEKEVMRLAYIQAKREGKSEVVPLFAFTLSREDVFDHIENMNMDVEQFPVIIYAKKRSKKYILDSLRCGEWCFGLMYEKEDRVSKFSLRMSDEYARQLMEKYTSVRKSLFPKGDNWYDFIIDSSVSSKKEVYQILNDCYFYVLSRYYVKNEEGKYVTDKTLAEKDEEKLANEINENKDITDEMHEEAIREYEKAKKTHQAKYGQGFRMTRRRILRYTRRTGGNDVTVHESVRVYLPSRLKTKAKTYAMVYEKNGEVSLTVRVSDKYADWLAVRHPEVRRARFPKNRNWYLVPIDSTFTNAQTVYRVVNRAKKIIRHDKINA